MLETESPYTQDRSCNEEVLSLKDLVSSNTGMLACNYLVLSVKLCNEQTCIQITTTDGAPTTYIAFLPKDNNFDCNSLRFVAQSSAFPTFDKAIQKI
jgi:hypothetical protein